MILYGYSKHPRVLMQSSEQKFLKLDEKHKMLESSGIKEERIRLRMDYVTWEVLRDMREDFLFTGDRDEALLLCADKNGDICLS